MVELNMSLDTDHWVGGYISDSNTLWSYFYNTAELAVNGIQPTTEGNVLPFLPKYIQPRYVRLQNTFGGKRVITVSTLGNFNKLPLGLIVYLGDEIYAVVETVPEYRPAWLIAYAIKNGITY